MNNACQSCGHNANIHGDGGRCEGESHDSEYGRYACVCPIFVRDPDDEGDL